MNPVQIDARGVVLTCPQCGQRSRLRYDRLGRAFRCAKCQATLRLPGEPFGVTSDLIFEALISRSELPVLVDFWAPWCGPCKMVAPEIRKIAKETAGRLLVAKVNTEEVPTLGYRFRVTAIPTMTLLRNGLEIARHAGAMAATQIRKCTEQL